MATEEHKVTGERLVDRVKNAEGHTLMEIPLTMGIAGAMFLPVLVALGSIAALASHYTLIVERKDGTVTPAGEIGKS